jgi:predicted metal-binding membrane protein
MSPTISLERVLRHDRYVVGAALAVVTLLCWAWIYPMARDMYGAMDGPAAWMMATEWDARRTLWLCAMWIVMMAGMMLPSAAPMLLLYAGALRRRQVTRPLATSVYALGAGYLLVWTLFSVAATALQRILSETFVLTPMMEPAAPSLAAVVLLFAGIYQLTPLKSVCLQTCRSPLSFLMQHWRPGVTGAFVMGVTHGRYCLGCCWALMLVLFAGGVMNIYVIAGLTIVVLIEKLAPFGGQTGRALGVGLIGFAVWVLVRTAPTG